MLQLIYVSAAMKGITPFDIDSILAAARKRNAAAEVTGLLLYVDGNFLQILEGPRPAVEQIYAAIQKDPRHSGLLMMLRREVPARAFQGWSMGFERLERARLDRTAYPGLNEVFDIERSKIESRLMPQIGQRESDQIMAFLGSFYTITTREKL